MGCSSSCEIFFLGEGGHSIMGHLQKLVSFKKLGQLSNSYHFKETKAKKVQPEREREKKIIIK